MANLQDMRRYLNKNIENYGAVTSPDYKSFEKKYRNYIKKVAQEVGGELVRFSPNHYEFSCFVKRNDKYVYISISDVRYFKNEWYNHILIRTAKHERDYTGGLNRYTSLDYLSSMVKRMTE